MRLYIFLLLLVLSVMRCLWLSADVAELQPNGWRREYLCDEGRKVYNARNLVLYKKIVIDDLNEGYYTSPLYFLSVLGMFLATGVGLIEGRIVSIVYGILAVMMVYTLIRDRWGQKGGIAALLIFGLNFPFQMYNRLALVETMLIFLMLLAGYLLLRAEETHRGYLWAGVAGFLPFLAKPTGLIIVLVSIAYLLLSCVKDIKQGGRGIIMYGTGLVLAAACWGVWLLYPGAGNVQGMVDTLNFSAAHKNLLFSPVVLINNILDSLRYKHFLNLFKWMPLETGIAYLYAFAVIVRFVQKDAKLGRLELFAVLWLVLDFMYVSSCPYQHVRYFLPVFAPIVLLAIIGVVTVGEWCSWLVSQSRIVKMLFVLWVIPGVYIALYYPSAGTMHRYASQMPANVVNGIVSIAVCVFFACMWQRVHLSTFLKKRVAALGKVSVYAVIVLTFVSAGYYAYWGMTRTYDLVNASTELARVVGDDSVVLGEAAQTFVMGCRSKGIYASGTLNDDAFRKFNVNYVLVQSEFYHELFDQFSSELRMATELKKMYVKGVELRFFSLPKTGGEEKA